ncbi:MAG: Wzz/FepE/Etk N-terminal domain-containing protein, partial [Nitrososphaeria archaeon]
LRDYIRVILRRKRLIILITVFVMLITGILNYFLLPPVYRGSAVIGIAKIGDIPLLSTKDIQTQISSDAFLETIARRSGIPYRYLKNINLVTNTSTAVDYKLIIVNFDANDINVINTFFRFFIIVLNDFNRESYMAKISALKDKLSAIQKEIDSLNKQQESVFSKLRNLEQKQKTNSEYTLEYSLVLNVYNSIENQKILLSSQINEINLTINSSNLFFYQSEPVVLDSPVGPQKLLNVAIAGFVSFFFSILLAYFIEYWQSSKGVKNEL